MQIYKNVDGVPTVVKPKECNWLSDNNGEWRELFTLRPEHFLDMYTPAALGALEFMQHLGKNYNWAAITDTWVLRCIWLLFLALFAQFGYAGNLGATCGYAMIVVEAACVVLAIFDNRTDEDGVSATTADILPALRYIAEVAGLIDYCPGLKTIKGSRTLGVNNGDKEGEFGLSPDGSA